MSVTYATISSVGAGPGPRLKYEFYPETTNNTVTIAAENYTHVGPFSAVTDAQGGFSVAIPLLTDQGGASLVWRVVETPQTQIPARGLAARTIGHFTIPASIDYDDLIASAIVPTVVTPDIVTNVGNLAADAQTSANAAAASAASVNREQVNGVAGLDATGKLYPTRVPDLSATYLSRSARTQHAPAFGLYFPEAEGAAANGTTDDAAAINAALTAAAAAGNGARVDFARGKTYALGSQLTVPANARLQGQATLKMLASATSRALLIQDASDVQVSDLTIDMNKAATTDGGSTTSQQGIYVNANAANVARIKIRDVKVVNGWQRGISVVAGSGFSATDIEIRDCRVESVGHVGIFISGVGNADKTTASTSRNISVRGCVVTSPGVGGIQLVGVSYADVSDNVVDGGGTASGQGLCFGTTGTAIQVTDFTVARNRVFGFTTATRWGIVVSTNCTRFALTGNIVTGCAGGITIDPEDGNALGTRVNVSGSVTGNVVRGSLSSHGINVRMCSYITVVGNTSNASAGGNGLTISNALGATVVGNTACNNSGYGVAINGTNSGSGGHTVGPSTTIGNTSGATSAVGTPVANAFVPAFVDAIQASDQAVTSSTALVNSSLALSLEGTATYDFEALLIVDGATTGDVRTGFTFPSGATYYWSAVGPVTTATTTPATASTSGAEAAGNPALHGTVGVGSPTMIRVAGVITTTNAGTLQHRFAQVTSDVTATTLKAGSRIKARRIS